MYESSVYLFESIGATGVKRRSFSELSLLINDAALCVTRLKLQVFHSFHICENTVIIELFCSNCVMSMQA